MKEREFVVAVIIALIVPVLIGSIYFIDQYKHKENSNYVYKSKLNRELLLLENNKIENVILNDSENILHFKVNYASGENKYENYKIALDNVSFSPQFNNVNVKWILSMYDDEKDDFFEFSTGIIDREFTSPIVISPSISILLGDDQRFMFSYYIIDGMDENEKVTWNAELVLE